MDSYRTTDEQRYYGSDLNKFIAQFCTKKMIVNNIDCVMYKYGKNKIRIIESKHSKESSSSSQLNILKILSSVSSKDLFVEVFIISGDPPYDEVDIYKLNTEQSSLRVSKDKLISFLNFDLEFENL